MIVWGAPGAGKTSIARRLGLADRFHGDEPLGRMLLEAGDRIDWYAGPTLARLLGPAEKVAA